MNGEEMNKKQRAALLGVALSGMSLGLILPAQASSTPSYTTTVDQNSYSSSPAGQAAWNLAPDSQKPSGSAELVAGPLSPPAGGGSLRLYNTDAGQLTTVTSKTVAGVRLSDLTTISYSTYVDQDSAPGVALPSVKFGLSNTTLVYEPYLAEGNAAIQTGMWQRWDTTNGHRGWWDSKGVTNCKPATPCSWTEMVDAVDLPHTATLNDVRVAIGSGIANFDGNVDAVTLGTASYTNTFDFESNAVGRATVTRVDDSSPAGWTAEGANGTDATGSYGVSYVAGPSLSGLSGAGSVSLRNRGNGSYSAIVQDYFGGRGDLTQRYLGSIDNIELQTYRLATSTKGDYPSVRFEVRMSDPNTNFAFTSIVHVPAAHTGTIDAVQAIHGASTVDKAEWNVTSDIAGLHKDTNYTWAQIMKSGLRDAVITKALVMAGSSSGAGAFDGGVDTLKFDYRDGSSQLWDFEKAGVYPPGPRPTTYWVVSNYFSGDPTVDADGVFTGLSGQFVTSVYDLNDNSTPADTSDDFYGAHDANGNVIPTRYQYAANQAFSLSYRLQDPAFGLTEDPNPRALCSGTTDALGRFDCGTVNAGKSTLESWQTNTVSVDAYNAGADGAPGTNDDNHAYHGVKHTSMTPAQQVTHLQNKLGG